SSRSRLASSRPTNAAITCDTVAIASLHRNQKRSSRKVVSEAQAAQDRPASHEHARSVEHRTLKSAIGERDDRVAALLIGEVDAEEVDAESDLDGFVASCD